MVSVAFPLSRSVSLHQRPFMATSFAQSTFIFVPIMASNALGESQDPCSPYFLHPNENPVLVLVSSLLNGSNYHSWSRAIKMSLLSTNKLKFVDRSILMPVATDPLHPYWEQCNTMMLSWIMHSLEPSITQSVLWMDKAYEVWDELKERFSHGDFFGSQIYRMRLFHWSNVNFQWLNTSQNWRYCRTIIGRAQANSFVQVHDYLWLWCAFWCAKA